MLSKLKEYWGYFVGILAAIGGFLLYYLTLKNREINSLKALVDLADTQRQVDIVESEIKAVKANKKRTAKEEKEFDKALEKVKKRRIEIKNEIRKMTTKELIDHLNKDA